MRAVPVVLLLSLVVGLAGCGGGDGAEAMDAIDHAQAAVANASDAAEAATRRVEGEAALADAAQTLQEVDGGLGAATDRLIAAGAAADDGDFRAAEVAVVDAQEAAHLAAENGRDAVEGETDISEGGGSVPRAGHGALVRASVAANEAETKAILATTAVRNQL